MDLALKGRVAVITGPAKGMGAAISKAFAAEGCRVALLGRDVDGDRAGGGRHPRRREGGDRGRVRRHRCGAVRGGGRRDAGGVRRAHRHPGQRGGRLRPDRQDRRRDHAGGIPRHRRSQHDGLLQHHAGRAARHDRAALRQDRQCGRHLRDARARRPHGVFGLEMGAARHHQELRAGGRAAQHQRQLRRARHGGRAAIPRQGVRRHGAPPRHHRSRRRSKGTPAIMRSSASRPMRMSPMPACSWRATCRVRSPASISRSTAAGPCCEASDEHDRRSRHPQRHRGVAGRRHSGERRHQGRRRAGDRRAGRDAGRQGDARRRRHAPAAGRHRRPCAFPRSRLSAQGGFRDRHRRRGVRRRHHGVRHAEHHPADRHGQDPRRQARHGGAGRPCGLRPLRPARRGHHRACARTSSPAA